MKKMISLVAIAACLFAPNVHAGCFQNLCHQKVVVQKAFVANHHVVQAFPSVYYVPGVPTQNAGYLSDDERISKIVAKTVAATLNEMGLQPQLQAARANSGLTKCQKCHAPGKSASDHFVLDVFDARTAERVQYALVETDMSERAGLTQDEFKQLMIESRVVMAEANVTTQPLKEKNDENLFE